MVLFITLPYLYIKFVSCSVPIRKFVGLPDPDPLVREVRIRIRIRIRTHNKDPDLGVEIAP